MNYNNSNQQGNFNYPTFGNSYSIENYQTQINYEEFKKTEEKPNLKEGLLPKNNSIQNINNIPFNYVEPQNTFSISDFTGNHVELSEKLNESKQNYRNYISNNKNSNNQQELEDVKSFDDKFEIQKENYSFLDKNNIIQPNNQNVQNNQQYSNNLIDIDFKGNSNNYLNNNCFFPQNNSNNNHNFNQNNISNCNSQVNQVNLNNYCKNDNYNTCPINYNFKFSNTSNNGNYSSQPHQNIQKQAFNYVVIPQTQHFQTDNNRNNFANNNVNNGMNQQRSNIISYSFNNNNNNNNKITVIPPKSNNGLQNSNQSKTSIPNNTNYMSISTNNSCQIK